SPVPEVLYDQLPQLPRGQGVVVAHVLPESPATQAGLRRHDLLLQYDDEKIDGCERFARLVPADKPERKVKLQGLRGRRETAGEVALALGRVLRIAQTGRDHGEPRGTAKTGGPPSVSVAATPLEGGNLKVTIEYYQEGTGRLRTLTCSGGPDDIEQ